MCSIFLAIVAAGLAFSNANTWAAELRVALQFVCPDHVWTPDMLYGLPIETKPVVGAPLRGFCGLLRSHTSWPAADVCPKQHACKYNTHAHGAGWRQGWACLAACSCIRA
jgi:hypothetical protein